MRARDVTPEDFAGALSTPPANDNDTRRRKFQINRAALHDSKRRDAAAQTRRDAAAYDARVANRPRLQRPPRVPFVAERGRSIGEIEAALERRRGILV